LALRSKHVSNETCAPSAIDDPGPPWAITEPVSMPARRPPGAPAWARRRLGVRERRRSPTRPRDRVRAGPIEREGARAPGGRRPATTGQDGVAEAR
jgi:hypothetical protein